MKCIYLLFQNKLRNLCTQLLFPLPTHTHLQILHKSQTSHYYVCVIIVPIVCNTTQFTYHSDSLCLIFLQYGRTAIHMAAYTGHSHVLSYLLKVPGAVPNARDQVIMSL